MGVFTTVGRWLKPDQPRANGYAGSHRESGGRRPVAVDLHADADHAPDGEPHLGPDAELDGFELSAAPSQNGAPEAKPPRSRQELIAELQRNYQEVLGIVRKVDGHLDEQGQRARRLGEIAELFPATADEIAGLRGSHDRVYEGLTSLADALSKRDSVLTGNQRAMLDRLEEILGLMAESSQAERQLIGSLVEFRDVMGGMAAATERLTVAVEQIERRDGERTEQVIEAIRKTRSGVYAGAVVATICATLAIVLGFVAIVS